MLIPKNLPKSKQINLERCSNKARTGILEYKKPVAPKVIFVSYLMSR
jgi:hypothetical protein